MDTERRPTAFIINMHHPDGPAEPTNDDRAKMVLPLVTTFMEAYGCDNAEQAIGDLIADLGHLYDRLTDEDRDPFFDTQFATDFVAFVTDRSFAYYAEEVDEESVSGKV